MPQSYRKKPLGAWPEDKKHGATRSPQNIGESSISGHMPDPEADDDIDQMVNDVDLYTETDPEETGFGPENPHEADIAEEIDEAERARK